MKKLLSFILALAMVLPMLPLQALAEEIYPPELAGMTISAGVWGAGGRNYFAYQHELKEEDYPDLSEDEFWELQWRSRAGALVSCALDYEGKPVDYYFSEGYNHRLSLFSYEELDESLITVSQGDDALGATFSKIECAEKSDEYEGAYIYQAIIDFDIEGADVSVKYNDETLLAAFHPHTFEGDNPFVGEVWISSNNDDGTKTLEISGCNLPSRDGKYYIHDYELETALYESDSFDEEHSNLRAGILAFTMKLAVDAEDLRLDGSWFKVSLDGENPLYYFGDDWKEEAQLPMLTPLYTMQNQQGSGIDFTPASVKTPEAVTEPSATFTVKGGTYTSMRSRLGDGNWSAWGEIKDVTFNFTEGAFGRYTGYFEFKDDEGNQSQTISKSVSYMNSTQAEAPLSVGIKDGDKKKVAADEEGIRYITRGTDYFPYAVYGDKDDDCELEAVIVNDIDAYEAPEEPIENYIDDNTVYMDMKKISGTNVYETKKKLDTEYPFYRIAVRVKKGEFDVAAGKMKEIRAYCLDKPVIYSAKAFFYNSYYRTDGKYVLKHGNIIQVQLNGTSSYNMAAYATLNYLDTNDSKRSVTVPAKQREQYYSSYYYANLTVPDDAAQILSITYRIENTGNPSMIFDEKTYDYSYYYVDNAVNFTGILKEYKGARLRIEKNLGSNWYSEYYDRELTGAETVTLESMVAGNYRWSIIGKSFKLQQGEFTVTAKGGETVNIDVAQRELTDIDVYIKGANYNTVLKYRIISGNDEADIVSGTAELKNGYVSFKQIPKTFADGTTPTRLELFASNRHDYYSYYERYTELKGEGVNEYGVLVYNVQNGNNEIEAKLCEFETKTVKGIVYNALGDQIKSGINIAAYQTREMGWQNADGSFTDTKTAVTCVSTYYKDGSYTMNIWSAVDAQVEFSSYEYGRPSYQTLTKALPSEETHLDATLDFKSGGMIDVKLSVLKLCEKEETEGDGNQLTEPKRITKGNDFYGSERVSFGMEGRHILINDPSVNAGDSLTVWYYEGNDNTIDGSNIALVASSDDVSQNLYGSLNAVGYTANLGSNSIGAIIAHAKEYGGIAATVVPKTELNEAELEAMSLEERLAAFEEATRYEGYMYVYDDTGKFIASAQGRGRLEIKDLPASDQWDYYKVVTFRLDKKDENYNNYLDALNDISTIYNRALIRGLAGNNAKAFTRVEVENAEYTVLEDAAPQNSAQVALLGGVHFTYATEILPEAPEWMKVQVFAEPMNASVFMTDVKVYNIVDDSNPHAGLSSAFVNGAELYQEDDAFVYEFPYRYQSEDAANITFYTQTKASTGSYYEPKVEVSYLTEHDYEMIELQSHLNTMSSAAYYRSSGSMSYVNGTYYIYKANMSKLQKSNLVIPDQAESFSLSVNDVETLDEINRDKDDFGVVTFYIYNDKEPSEFYSLEPGDSGEVISWYNYGYVNIYDGATLLTRVYARRGKNTVTVKLPNADKFGTHILHAERTLEDGTVESTKYQTISLVNRAHVPYISDFDWIHQAQIPLKRYHFRELSDMAKSTVIYWPANVSVISFRINNVKEGDLENVTFRTTYHLKDTVWECSLWDSGIDEETGRPYCEYVVDPLDYDPTWGYDYVPSYRCSSAVYRSEPSGKKSTEGRKKPGTDEAIQHGQYLGGYWIPQPIMEYNMPVVPLGYMDYWNIDYEFVTAATDDMSEDEISQMEVENYYKNTDGALMDFSAGYDYEFDEEAWASESKAALPAVFRDGFAQDAAEKTEVEVKENSADTYSYEMTRGENSINYTVDASDTTEYNSDDIAAQMESELAGETFIDEYADPNNPSRIGKRQITWSKYDSAQGTVYIKQIITDFTQFNEEGTELASGGTVDRTIAQEIYAPKTVVEELKASGNTKSNAVLNSVLSGASKKNKVLKANEHVDKGLERLSNVGTLHGGMDIAQEYLIKALQKGKDVVDQTQVAKDVKSVGLNSNFNQGMAVVGAGLTAYDIAKGIQGKDPNVLYNAIKALDPGDAESRKAITSLMNEVTSYQDRISQTYILDSFANGGSTVMGNTPVPISAKLALLLGGLGYNKISGYSKEYHEMEFDSVLRSILVEIQKQERRELQKWEERVEVEENLYDYWRRIAKRENWQDFTTMDGVETVEMRIKKMVEQDLNKRIKYEKMPRYKKSYRVKMPYIRIDPSGYVFEVLPENRIEGITATVYKKTTNGWEQWDDDSEEDRQENPQTTAAIDENDEDAGGRYGWMTPEGQWKVVFTDPSGKFKTSESKSMLVPPEHTQVNIALLSNEAPEIKTVEEITGGRIAITFSKYMQMESLVEVSPEKKALIKGNKDEYDAASSSIQFYDMDGNLISGKFYFPPSMDTLGDDEDPSGLETQNRVKNKYYKSGTYQKDEIASDYFANMIIFSPDDINEFDSEHTTLAVSQSVRSYAGVEMNDDFSFNLKKAFVKYSSHKHTMEYHEQINPTCVKNGTKAYYYCTECQKDFTDEFGENEITDLDALLIEQTPHIKLEHHSKINATCTAQGTKEFYRCTVCNNDFYDILGENEVTDPKDLVIAKTAHSYKTVTTKATLTKNGSIVKKCSVCGAISSTTVVYYPKTIALSAAGYTYDGKVKKPSVKVKDSKGKTVAASNYTVTYASGRKNVGSYTVKIAFKGNYSGTKTLSFKINPKATTVSKVTSPKAKQLKVTWKKQMAQTTGYEIQYSTDKNFKKGVKTATVNKNGTTSKTLTGLTAKKKYYVRIRTYKTVGKTKFYSAWSKSKSAKTK